MPKENLTTSVVEYVMTCSEEVLGKMTVSSLASRFQVDRSHLAREFKAFRNWTLSEFIQSEKMFRAATGLRECSDLTVEELSQRLGFCSVGYFRAVFKRHFAVLPSHFRKYKQKA